jgi:hypothetical protein
VEKQRAGVGAFAGQVALGLVIIVNAIPALATPGQCPPLADGSRTLVHQNGDEGVVLAVDAVPCRNRELESRDGLVRLYPLCRHQNPRTGLDFGTFFGVDASAGGARRGRTNRQDRAEIRLRYAQHRRPAFGFLLVRASGAFGGRPD